MTLTTTPKNGLIKAMGHRSAARVRGGRAARLAYQFLASALAVLLVGVTLLSGTRYFHCSMENEARLSSCCPDHQHDDAVDSAELRSTSCCEPRVVQGFPTAQTTRVPDVAAAPLVAVLPPFDATTPILVRVERILTARGGIDPPTASQARAHLMVFLI